MSTSEAFSWYLQNNHNYKEKTKKNYLSAMNSFIRVVGDVPVHQIGIDYIIRWDRDMELRGNTKTARNTDLTKMRVVLSFLSDNGMNVLDKNKIKLPKRDTKPKEFLTPLEIRELLSATTTVRDKAIIAMLFNTGCRISELLNLNRSDFDNAPVTKSGDYSVWVCGKGDKYREVYFNTRTKVLVDRYLATRNDPFKPLFTSGQHSRITVSRVEQIIHRAAATAGLEKNVTPHTLRHSFATDLLTNDAPLKDTQELLGHAKSSTTIDIYHHILNTKKQHTQRTYQTQVL